MKITAIQVIDSEDLMALHSEDDSFIPEAGICTYCSFTCTKTS